MSSVPGTSVRSRRSVLTTAAAADHAAIVQGETASGTLTTIVDGGNANPAFKGVSGSGIGAWGSSTSNFGLYGTSNSNAGVTGLSQQTAGVFGWSGSTGTSVPNETGVYGFCGTSGDSRGVSGESPAGIGVYGTTSTGAGVTGTSTNSTGVVGTSAGTGGFGVYGEASGISGIGVTGYADQASGVGGYFYTVSPLLGTGLIVIGKVRLDQAAGLSTIKKRARSVVVRPGCKVSSLSAVTATLMGSAGGTLTVHRVVASASHNTFTIYLTGTATVAAKVAWHIFN